MTVRVPLVLALSLLAGCSALFSESPADSDGGLLGADASTNAPGGSVNCREATMLASSNFADIKFDARWTTPNDDALVPGMALGYDLSKISAGDNTAIRSVASFAGDFAMDMAVNNIFAAGNAHMIFKLQSTNSARDISVKVFHDRLEASALDGTSAAAVERPRNNDIYYLRFRRSESLIVAEHSEDTEVWNMLNTYDSAEEYHLRFAGSYDEGSGSPALDLMRLHALGTTCE